jgi:hypothetical protein
MPRKLNVELAEKVLKQVTDHPETHDQAHWMTRGLACGTTACLAGWALRFGRPDAELLWQDGVGGKQIVIEVVVDGTTWGADEAAAEVLGLDSEEADELFLSMNKDVSIDMLAAWIERAKADAA